MRGHCRAWKLPRRSNPRLYAPRLIRHVRTRAIRRDIYAHDGRPFARTRDNKVRYGDDGGEHDSGGKPQPSLRLAGHGTTDELWPMNVLALWTRGRGDASLIRTLGTRMHGREMEGNLEFGTIPRELPPTFGGSVFSRRAIAPALFSYFRCETLLPYSVPRIDLCYIFSLARSHLNL